MIKYKVYILFFLIFSSLFFYQNYIIKNMKKEINFLVKENAEISIFLNESQKNLENLNNNFNSFKKNVEFINNEFNEIREEKKEFDNKFKDHDLKRLIESKPKLMQNIINNGTKKVFDEFKEDKFEEYRNTNKKGE